VHRFRLSGLAPHSRYALRFQDASAAQNRTQRGEELMQHGVSVALPSPLTSELVFFQMLP
jgi:glycosyl hydrolase family 36